MSNPLGRRARPTTNNLDRAAPPNPLGIPGMATIDTVSGGDTLQNLAKKHYGNPLMWTHIYTANAGTLGNSPRLVPGQILTIPNA